MGDGQRWPPLGIDWVESVTEEPHAADQQLSAESSDEILVSMIMGTNRVSPFLDEALASMVNQTHPRVEIIVVDDGCRDPASLDGLLATYSGVRVHHQTGAGVSVARNVGAYLARGELIGFFDDDDRYPPDWVERHVANLEAHPEAVLSYGGLRHIDADDDVLGMDTLGDLAPEPASVRRRQVQILGGSFLIRRADFAAVGGFNPLFRRAQDLDFVLRCNDRGPLVPAPGLVRDYRIHPDNATRDHRLLAASIRSILRLHEGVAAGCTMRTSAAHDYLAALASNRRFAIWRGSQYIGIALRHGRVVEAMTETAWMLGFAPEALAVLLAKGIRDQANKHRLSGR